MKFIHLFRDTADTIHIVQMETTPTAATEFHVNLPTGQQLSITLTPQDIESLQIPYFEACSFDPDQKSIALQCPEVLTFEAWNAFFQLLSRSTRELQCRNHSWELVRLVEYFLPVKHPLEIMIRE